MAKINVTHTVITTIESPTANLDEFRSLLNRGKVNFGFRIGVTVCGVAVSCDETVVDLDGKFDLEQLELVS